MAYHHLTAHYDGKSIVLDEPVALPAGTELVVLVPQEGGETLEQWREGWLRFSADGLSRAYSDNEPEYTIADAIS